LIDSICDRLSRLEEQAMPDAKPTEELYAERLSRYVTAMRNGQPDRVPLRPLAAEITARYAGFTCQEVTHDYNKAFEAVIRCCRDFDWDAVVPNMVWVWTGLTQSIGLRYYGVPGIDVDPDVGFQYREPTQQDAFMTRDDYDDLIATAADGKSRRKCGSAGLPMRRTAYQQADSQPSARSPTRRLRDSAPLPGLQSADGCGRDRGCQSPRLPPE
jgi:hypothetical protein